MISLCDPPEPPADDASERCAVRGEPVCAARSDIGDSAFRARAPNEEKPKPGTPGPAISPEPERTGMQAVYVPANFIIYKCKLAKGRVIDIPLPPEFTTAEMEKLYAFLKTQVDDLTLPAT
jgi:hypothetical protein